MKKFNIGDIVYFESCGKKGKGKILEENVGMGKNCYLLEMLDECNRREGHNGVSYCAGHYTGNNCWYVNMDGSSLKLVAPANSESIHITRDGDKVHAIFKYEDRVVKRTEAKCHPDDIFDFMTGVRIAFERLSEDEKEDTKEDDEIKVGDVVKIVDKGEMYSSYCDWFDEACPELASRYAYCYNRENDYPNGRYKVLTKHSHLLDPTTTLCAIQECGKYSDRYDPIFLINIKGIEKVKD